MAEYDPSAGEGKRLRGGDELLFTQYEHLGSCETRVHAPCHGEDRNVDTIHARPDDGQDGDDENKEGKRDDDVHEPHNHCVDPAAEVAGHGSKDDSIDQWHVRCQEADLEV